MNIQGLIAIRAGFAMALALGFPPQATAQGKGELWDVTVTMEMPGMPAAIPPRTSRVCAAPNRRDVDWVPKQGECKVLESKRVGTKFSYQMECAGSHPSTVVGEVVFGNNVYDGRMKMTMNNADQTMNMVFSGKRVAGDCTPTVN